MCGRYASIRSATDLAALFDVEDLTDGELAPDYNLAPTDPAPIVRLVSGPAAGLTVARWGFVPAWARDASGAARMINARIETVASSRVFAEAVRERRCLVPAEGWYEWRRVGGLRSARQPYFMTRPEGVVFAGIWSVSAGARVRPPASGEPLGNGDVASPLVTFSIITMPAQGELATVHDRMPLLLEPSRWDAWLHSDEASRRSAGAAGSTDVTALLIPPSPAYCAEIEIRPVSTSVGDVRNDGPELVRRIALAPPQLSIVDDVPTLF